MVQEETRRYLECGQGPRITAAGVKYVEAAAVAEQFATQSDFIG